MNFDTGPKAGIAKCDLPPQGTHGRHFLIFSGIFKFFESQYKHNSKEFVGKLVDRRANLKAGEIECTRLAPSLLHPVVVLGDPYRNLRFLHERVKVFRLTAVESVP